MAAACSHDGFHSAVAHYDREGAELVFLSTCEICGVVLSELGRQRYRPRYRRTADLTAARKNACPPPVELSWS